MCRETKNYALRALCPGEHAAAIANLRAFPLVSCDPNENFLNATIWMQGIDRKQFECKTFSVQNILNAYSLNAWTFWMHKHFECINILDA